MLFIFFFFNHLDRHHFIIKVKGIVFPDLIHPTEKMKYNNVVTDVDVSREFDS